MPPEDETRTLDHGGLERTFHVHVPPSYDGSPTPLVFNFHGYMSNAWQEEFFSEMTDKSDIAGFIVVYPEGTGIVQSWNAGDCCGSAVDDDLDDVGFTDAMIDDLAGHLCLDMDRIYATGMSNGGFLSHRLACELSHRIAAVAPVAGVLGIDDCAPSRPMPLMHFHGTADNSVPYDGGGLLGMRSVAETMFIWVGLNGCDASPVEVFNNGDSHCETYPNCDAGVELTLCTVEGGGHTWPGGAHIPFLGHTTEDLNANDAMWDFFMAHPMP
jgi:polyhydroxybutyrate depolymerase